MALRPIMALRRLFIGLLPLSLMALATASPSPASYAVSSCTVNGHASEHVYGVLDTLRISWQLLNSARGAAQIYYTVNITDTDGYHHSATQQSSKQLFVTSTSQLSLKPGAAYSFRVSAVMIPQGTPTPACEGSFEMAPSSAVFPGESKWIGGGGLLQTAQGLTLPSTPALIQARAYVSGVGAFYLYVNGQRVGRNVMDPPQTVYSKRVLYETFDVTSFLKPGRNDLGALLGTYKLGYTDLWCNMTTAGGPDGCRALVITVVATLANGASVVLRSTPGEWCASPGPVLWDHFFHGETFDGRVGMAWHDDVTQACTPAREIEPPAGYPTGMGVFDPQGTAIALGELTPTNAPPLRIISEYPAVSVSSVRAVDVGTSALIYDFGVNMAGMTRLSLPAAHGIPRGTELRIEHAEVLSGSFVDTGNMCKVCPLCPPCSQPSACLYQGEGAVCNTYCHNPAQQGGVDGHPLRQEPCFPHQTYGYGHWSAASNQYIGDFNNANQTNVYIVEGSGQAEEYTPFFAGGGFRYAQLSGLPESFKQDKSSLLSGLKINSDVPSVSELQLPEVAATGGGTADVLNKIHQMTRRSQQSNLWSIPTDCPQRERRGWTGDAQASSDEAMLNFDMNRFYEKFLDDMHDDQKRFNGNHANDTGAIADVVPYDGIGGNPGCPVWQVAFIVIARNSWKHYGSHMVPILTKHYDGLKQLMAWFDRHADSSDGLLVISCYGDWMGFNPETHNERSSALTPRESVTAFYHVLAMRYMSEISGGMGLSNESAYWSQRHTNGQQAYHARFFDHQTQSYSPCVNQCHNTSSHGSQTSNAMALALGAPPTEAIAAQVASYLAADVESFADRTTTGVVGIAWLFPMLDRYGYGDRALGILMGDQYPSLGHMAAQNMTTLCENWACTFHDAGGSSQNHIMFGGFDAWVQSSIGGLDSAVNASTGGWEHIIVRVSPGVVATLKEASNSHQTRFGAVTLAWSFEDSGFGMTLSVPVGCTAEVHHPTMLSGQRLASVTERGQTIWKESALAMAPGVQSVEFRPSERAVVATVGSGSFTFEGRYH